MVKMTVVKSKKRIGGSWEKEITRKEAIKKTGLMAASAATMMILLKTPRAQGHSAKACETQFNHQKTYQLSSEKNNGPWKSSGSGGNGGPGGNGGK